MLISIFFQIPPAFSEYIISLTLYPESEFFLPDLTTLSSTEQTNYQESSPTDNFNEINSRRIRTSEVPNPLAIVSIPSSSPSQSIF